MIDEEDDIRKVQPLAERIKNKWSPTGLLTGLDDEAAYKMSQLCENQALYTLREPIPYGNIERIPGGLVGILPNISFPLIRRIFDPAGYQLENPVLTFTYETTAYPAFIVYRPDKYDGKEIHTQTANTYLLFESCPTFEEITKILGRFHRVIDAEVELAAILADRFRNELNEKYSGKHLIFYTPITVVKSDDGEDTLGSRCTVLPGGSSLAAGGYERLG